MSRTEIGASVDVEFKSIGEMRQAIKQATSDLIAMQQQFGESSPQAQELARRIGEMRDQLADANEQIENFSPGNRFKAFADAASLVASGFTALQGAMNLVGIESKNVEEQLVKLQSLMALSEGLSQLGEAGEAFSRFKDVVVDVFKSIRAAIGSTGIGLLVIALGTIVAYWDDIKAAVSGVSEEQKKLNEDAEKNVKAQQEKLDAISKQENILKLQGKTERDILNLKIKATDEAIIFGEISLKNSIATAKSQLAAAERNKTILQGILEFIGAPLGVLLKGVDAIGSALGKNFNLYDKFFGGISSFVFDPEKTKQEGKAAVKAQQDALIKLQNDRAGFINQRKEIDKKEAADQEAKDDEKLKKDLEKQAAANKVLDDARRAKLTERQREEEDVLRAFEERKKALVLAGKTDFTAIEEQKGIELAAIKKKYDDIEAERLKKIEDEQKKKEEERVKKEQETLTKKSDQLLKDAESDQLSFDQRLAKIQEREALINQITFASQEEKTAFEKANAEARIAIAEQEAQAKIAFTQDIGNALGTLSDIIGKETAAGKALAVAQATINTWLGVTEVLKQKSVLPEPAATISKVINVASIVASGINAVRNIVRTQVPKGGGGGSVPSVAGGGGAPIAAQPSPTVTAQALNAQAINNLGNQGMRAYVLNSDITNNEQRNAYLQRNARLG